MTSIRPVSLKKIIRILSTIRDRGTITVSDIARLLNVSDRHVNELARFLSLLNLVSMNTEGLTLSSDGALFLDSFEKGDYSYVDSVFRRFDSYVNVTSCLEKGLRRPSEIAACAGVSVLVADIISRLAREVMTLRYHGVSEQRVSLDYFVDKLLQTYRTLSSSRRSKYVSLSEIQRLLFETGGIPPGVFPVLLERAIQASKLKVLLTPSPNISSRPSVKIGGRSYAYLAIL